MVNCWAIAIGIDQYEKFQPLMYAQRDAQALRDFLVNDAGCPAAQCLLLTDTSPTIGQGATYPSRDNIQRCLTEVCQQHLQADDLLWVFFSGYGVRLEGRDYLMPTEGDPDRIPETGILMESVFATLQAAPTDRIVLVLDMNRSQSTIAGERVGEQTASLAYAVGIPTILSCQPDQFSHETIALRQGLFTTAIIEGLRSQGRITLESLAQYVGDRLPELSEHHWRPKQQPLAVIPAQHRYQLLIPSDAPVPVGAIAAPDIAAPDLEQPPSSNGATPTIERPDSTLPAAPHPPVILPAGTTNLLRSPASPNGQNAPPESVLGPPGSAPDTSDPLFWRKLILVGGAIVLALLLGVLLRNREVLTNQPADPGATVAPITPGTVTPGDNTPEDDSPGDNIPGGDAPGGDTPGTAASEDPAQGLTTDPEAGVLPGGGQSVPTEAIAPAAGTALAAAQQAFQEQRYEDTLRQLAQVPADQQNEAYARLRADTERELRPLQEANRAILNAARASINQPRASTPVIQASDFSRAITVASQIQPGQPLYPQAQQDIERWGRVILDIATGRSEQRNQGSTIVAARNFASAIAAARLIRPDQADLYAEAQEAIARWSQSILGLANARAREGRLDLARQTAQLVPQGTSAYQAAQAAIAQWNR